MNRGWKTFEPVLLLLIVSGMGTVSNGQDAQETVGEDYFDPTTIPESMSLLPSLQIDLSKIVVSLAIPSSFNRITFDPPFASKIPRFAAGIPDFLDDVFQAEEIAIDLFSVAPRVTANSDLEWPDLPVKPNCDWNEGSESTVVAGRKHVTTNRMATQPLPDNVSFHPEFDTIFW